MSMCFPAENLAFKSSAMNGGEILLSEKHRDGHAQRQENTANGPLIKALWVSSKALNGMPTPEDLSMPISGSTGHQNGVRFRWLKTGIMEENSVDVIRGIRHYKEPALDLPAVFVEDVSRRPGDKSLKGWANIKYTMDYVLGRSIVPTAKHKFSKTSYSAGKDVSLLQKAVSQRHVVNNSNCLASRSTGEQIENSPQIQNDQLLSSDDKSRSIAKHKLSKTSRSAGKDVSFSQKAASQTYGIKNSNGLASLSANKQFENSPQIQNDQLHSPDDNSRSKAKDKLNKRSCSAGKDLSCSQKAVSQGHGIKNSNCLESLSASKQIENSPQIQNDQLPSSDIKSKSIAKQFLFVRRDAAAGAFAGICVSLCLHPIDTVKTVIQSQSIGSRSVFRTVLAIISDRGFSGLYRGLGSNLASSGPISAIYTFTYESVKAALLPHLPREYHAIAHCTAGGCASIATSVVYTPSECVKQRMQVGCFQRNSWLTFLAILRNEGPSVLYSGWLAVLCRNVPQSIIKFYTYEGLKNCALSKKPAEKHLSTYQTLAFGGLAGCTAAMFTTPFDVIKTRLQTQLPGSALHQKSVMHIFQHIATTEGIHGLYRGLIPRLVIYLSQGALFFASYEFFKRLLEMEVPKLSTLPYNSTESLGQGNIIEPT